MVKQIMVFGLLLAGAGWPAMASESFEVAVAHRFVGPIQLEGGRLLAIDRTLEMIQSIDKGRTWTSIGPFRDAAGRVII